MRHEPTRRLPRAEAGPVAPARRVAAVAARHCFADEIGIDFPSVEAVVDRMRDAFLAPDEPPPPLSAAISVSALDAWTGTRVPLDLPVRGTCRACGGRGEIWTDACEPCGGSGEAIFTHPVQVSVPPRVGDGTWIRLQVSTPDAPLTRIDVRVTVGG